MLPTIDTKGILALLCAGPGTRISIGIQGQPLAYPRGLAGQPRDLVVAKPLEVALKEGLRNDIMMLINGRPRNPRIIAGSGSTWSARRAGSHVKTVFSSIR